MKKTLFAVFVVWVSLLRAEPVALLGGKVLDGEVSNVTAQGFDFKLPYGAVRYTWAQIDVPALRRVNPRLFQTYSSLTGYRPAVIAPRPLAPALPAVAPSAPVPTPSAAAPGDWPRWRGVNFDGASPETGLPSSWPASGLKELWRVPLGAGYSGISVVQGRLFTMASVGNDEFVICLDAASGRPLWKFRTASNYENNFGGGPRAQPTVEGGRVYALGAKADLVCLHAADGQKIWEMSIEGQFNSQIPRQWWGFSMSPLIEGDMLIINPGGRSASVVALNKADGKLIWKSGEGGPAYASPIAVTVGGVRQAIAFSSSAVMGLDPKTGKVYWTFPWTTRFDANIATPLLAGDHLFISTGYGTGCALLKLSAEGGVPKASEVYRNKEMKNHFNSSVAFQDHVYGFDDAALKCLELKTGRAKWEQQGFAKGSLLLADGHLIILGERGDLAMAKAAPDGYEEKSRMKVFNTKTWTMPTLAGGKLYLRDEKEIVCLQLK